MPTHAEDALFRHDSAHLIPDQRQAFMTAVRTCVDDLREGSFRKGLYIKRVSSRPGVCEMTWADTGRATFSYGETTLRCDPQTIWRRIGTHDILDEP